MEYDLMEDIISDHIKNKIIFICGSGISVGATKENPKMSWKGLLIDGLDFACKNGEMDAEEIETQKDRLNDDDIDGWIEVAETVKKKLGERGEFKRWLSGVFGNVGIEDPTILRKLKQFAENHGCVIATTNYDGLLEECTGYDPITYKDNIDEIIGILFGGDKGILHFHGHWKSPESVVLGYRDYKDVVNDDQAQTALKTARIARTVVFIGSGGGLEDPNIGAFLKWAAELFIDSESRIYVLAREGESEKLREKFPLNEWRVMVVRYGKNHKDLGPWLELLLHGIEKQESGDVDLPGEWVQVREKTKESSVPHYMPKDEQIGRDTQFNKIYNIISKKGRCLIHGMPGIGKTFMALKIHEEFSNGFDCVWIAYQGGGDIQYEKALNILLDKVNIKVREDLTTEEKESKLMDELNDNRIILFVDDIDDVEKINIFVKLSKNVEMPLLVTSQTYGNDLYHFNDDDFIYLEELSVDDSIRLFESKANIECHNHRGVIKDICKFLEYHPFAISVAAGLVRKNFGVCGLYNVLQRNIEIIDSRYPHYGDKLKGPLAAFYVAYTRLGDDAKDLFSKIAILSTGQLGLELLIKFTDTGTENSLIPLTDRGLLEYRSETDKYVMHQLVQKSFNLYVKLDIEKKTRGVMENIVEYLDENKYWDDVKHRTNIKNEIDNILYAMEWFEDRKDYANLIKLESRMRHFFYVLGYWKQRRRWSKKVYNLRHEEDLLLADYGHEIVMAGLEGLGFLYVRDNKKYETAITIAEDANKIIERIGKNANGTYKSKDWKRAKCFYYRMKGISERNDYRAAADCLEKAYDLAGESDWESVKVAIGINLGVSYLDLERVDDAIKLFEESEKLALETTPRLHRRRVNALIGIGNAKTAKLVKEYGTAGWNSKNIREAASHFKNAWEVDKEYVQDEPYLFVNIAKGVSKLLSHVEGVNIMLENLEKKTTDLENCKVDGNWNLRDFTKIRKQTNSILNTIFKYINV